MSTSSSPVARLRVRKEGVLWSGSTDHPTTAALMSDEPPVGHRKDERELENASPQPAQSVEWAWARGWQWGFGPHQPGRAQSIERGSPHTSALHCAPLSLSDRLSQDPVSTAGCCALLPDSGHPLVTLLRSPSFFQNPEVLFQLHTPPLLIVIFAIARVI